MDCGRAPTALAAAAPAPAPARRAGCVAKWAASDSSMQPDPVGPVVAPGKFPETPVVYAHINDLSPNAAKRWLFLIDASVGHALHDHGGVCAPETERIRQCDIDFA